MANPHGTKEGYNTVIGKQGSGLSNGKRQRMVIARALVNNLFILILDEVTSALNYESEYVIMKYLQNLYVINHHTLFINGTSGK